MDNSGYSELLKKVKSAVEKREEKKRFQIPRPEIITEGKLTIVKNFADIVDTINRDEIHVFKYLVKQFGLSGEVSDGRLILKGKPPDGSIERAIQEFLKIYVECYECGNFDTEIKRENRNEVIRCKACGAERPVHAHREIRYSEEKIEEGKTYDLEIKDLNRDGDGISVKRDVTVIIPGAKKGEKVTVKIERVRKNYAVGILVKKT